MQDDEIINNFSTWTILKNISITNLREEVNINELAHMINIDKHHPYFCKIIKFLVNKKIISLSITKTYGNTKLVKIDIKKLDQLVESSPVYTEFQSYIHAKKLFYANI